MANTDSSASAEEGLNGRPAGTALTRVTVNLTRKAMEALESMSDSTGDSKTDTINRALQVYAVIHSLLDKNGGLVIKQADSETEIKLFIV